MSPGSTILLIATSATALVATLTITAIRWLKRSPRREGLLEDGVLLTEDGLEFPRFLPIGTYKVKYADVECVESLPFWEAVVALLLFRYDMFASVMWRRLGSDVVVIKLRGPRLIRYHVLTPRDASRFVKLLRSRVPQATPAAGGA
jgi:hypothetical protein